MRVVIVLLQIIAGLSTIIVQGEPANSTLTVLLLIYRYAFQNSLGGDYGMAAALSLMLAVFLDVYYKNKAR